MLILRDRPDVAADVRPIWAVRIVFPKACSSSTHVGFIAEYFACPWTPWRPALSWGTGELCQSRTDAAVGLFAVRRLAQLQADAHVQPRLEALPDDVLELARARLRMDTALSARVRELSPERQSAHLFSHEVDAARPQGHRMRARRALQRCQRCVRCSAETSCAPRLIRGAPCGR